MTPIVFENAWWLLGVFAAVPMGVLGLRWFASMGAWRRWSALLTRACLIALVFMMLAGASAVRPAERLSVVLVVDVSGSVRRFVDGGAVPSAQELLRRVSDGRGPDDLLGAVAFDSRAMAIAKPTSADVAGRGLDVYSAEGTDIESALRQAAALIPADSAGRLVLISDGNETAGDLLAASRELSARGLPIDVIPLAYRVGDEVVVESVDLPPRARAESAVVARVTLRAGAPAAGTLYLTREGEVVDLSPGSPGSGRAVALDRGVNVVRLEVPLPAGRVHRFEAVFEPSFDGAEPVGDTFAENNRASAFTVSPGKGSVLIIGRGGALAAALRSGGIDVRVSSTAPGDLLALQAYDLVILNNVPAEDLTPTQHELLAAHVRDAGAGLVMVGGVDSFGAGGWKGTAIEPILPVKLDLPGGATEPGGRGGLRARSVRLDEPFRGRVVAPAAGDRQRVDRARGADDGPERPDRRDLVQRRRERGGPARREQRPRPDRRGGALDLVGRGDQPVPGAGRGARTAPRVRRQAQAGHRALRRVRRPTLAAAPVRGDDEQRRHPRVDDRGGRRRGRGVARVGGGSGRRAVLQGDQPVDAAEDLPARGAGDPPPADPGGAVRAGPARDGVPADDRRGRHAGAQRAGADAPARGADDHVRDGGARRRAGAGALERRAREGRRVHVGRRCSGRSAWIDWDGLRAGSGRSW